MHLMSLVLKVKFVYSSACTKRNTIRVNLTFGTMMLGVKNKHGFSTSLDKLCHKKVFYYEWSNYDVMFDHIERTCIR
uniref:Uncharacterized protein n=1 Tax=Pararge aegeria TaxID=116150 RepID=S4NNP3_9NEOP